MKKIICHLLMFSVFVFASRTVLAQMPTASERATKTTNWMKSNLKLTDDQVSKVQDINLKYANKMDELKNSTDTKKQKMATMKSDESAKDAELKTVLNDSQYQSWLQKKEEMKKEMKEKMKEKKSMK
ncbi:hypothetical protein QEG73_17485 [Chitinophagaceae bacterium 26-R-25]|nr:hypothetical protein [Chitinophagaceae bacterium 26-R-25]